MFLETSRCLIRDWRDDEADRLLDIYQHDEVSPWIGSVPRATRWRQLTAPFGGWAVEERATGVVAGTILLSPYRDGEVEVGWHFHPDSWGRGLATEAARAVIAYGFSLGLPEIFAVVRPDNDRSLAVCKRLGMTALGRTDRWYDTELEAFELRQRPVA